MTSKPPAHSVSTIAREYLRVSADPSGRLHSPEEQHLDNKRAAVASGWFAIRWMLRLVQRVSLRWFALYTGVLGVLVLLDRFVFHVLL